MMAAPAPHSGIDQRADAATEPPPRGGTMRVFPDRLRHNADVLRRTYGPQVIAVIKGDGYGLGLVTCAAVFASAGIRVMAVGSIVEAALVRAAGLDVRLIVLDSDGLDLPSADVHVEWLVGQVEMARLVARDVTGSRLHIHVDIDFGVGRGGVPSDQADGTLAALLHHPGIRIVGLAGQLPANPSEDAVRKALTTLNRLRHRCPEAIAHLGGSDVLRWHRPARSAWVRIGRPLYGIMPRTLHAGDGMSVVPAWAWQAGATAYKAAPSVGYRSAPPPDGTPVRLGVGFADGLPPQAAGHWPVLVDGHRYTIHEVFMLSSIAYPAGDELPPRVSGTALLSGRYDRYCLPARQIAESLGVATTAVLMCPRSRREVATG